MMLYEIQNKIYDSINGVSLYRGDVIETDDDLWAKRWGPATVQPISVVPPGRSSFKLKSMVEGASKKEDKAKKEDEAKKSNSEPKAVLRPMRAKIMDVDSGTQKFKE